MRTSPRHRVRQAIIERLKLQAASWPEQWPLGKWPEEWHEANPDWPAKHNIFSGLPTWRADECLPDICVVTPSDTIDEEAPLTPAMDLLVDAPEANCTWVQRIMRVTIEVTIRRPKAQETIYDHLDQFVEAVTTALDGWTPTSEEGPYSGVVCPIVPAEISIDPNAVGSDGGMVAVAHIGFDVRYRQPWGGWTPESMKLNVKSYERSSGDECGGEFGVEREAGEGTVPITCHEDAPTECEPTDADRWCSPESDDGGRPDSGPGDPPLFCRHPGRPGAGQPPGSRDPLRWAVDPATDPYP